VSTSLAAVLQKNHHGPGSAVAGTPYPALVDLVKRMQAEDPKIIFDSLRPLGDEFWNMIDGERTVGEIANAVCLQFGFSLSPDLFIPLVDGMISSQAASVVNDAATTTVGGEERQ
jgi:hypothetical protein